ncbi:hypothetical protein ACLOJK_001064 [Asimina triloba]
MDTERKIFRITVPILLLVYAFLVSSLVRRMLKKKSASASAAAVQQPHSNTWKDIAKESTVSLPGILFAILFSLFLGLTTWKEAAEEKCRPWKAALTVEAVFAFSFAFILFCLASAILYFLLRPENQVAPEFNDLEQQQ